MRHIYHILSLCLIGISTAISLSAHTIYQTAACKSDIKTLRVMLLDDAEASTRPFLQLGSDQVLDISFDEMSHDTHQYTYTLLHLNRDFTQSDLLSSEYLEGFTTLDITDYEHSSLTQTLYTHYRFEFPNQDMRPKISGNYAIKIYEDGNTDDIVAIVCFQVTEQTALVNASVRGNTDIEFNKRYQQLDIDVNMLNLTLNNPQDVTLVVQQNNRRDNQAVLTRPTYINGQKLSYSQNRALIFEGGNEYRRFDISSEYIKGRQVDKIQFDHQYYHAFLFPDELRRDLPYVYDLDANGQYVINAERRDDDDYEADYMYVYFLLETEPFFTGSVYIIGDFDYNMISPDTRLYYDIEHKCYTYSAFLKQGAYEYLYVLQEKGKTAATTEPIEGSYWQTKNDYSIAVYYRPFGARYDRLVALYHIQ